MFSYTLNSHCFEITALFLNWFVIFGGVTLRIFKLPLLSKTNAASLHAHMLVIVTIRYLLYCSFRPYSVTKVVTLLLDIACVTVTRTLFERNDRNMLVVCQQCRTTAKKLNGTCDKD